MTDGVSLRASGTELRLRSGAFTTFDVIRTHEARPVRGWPTGKHRYHSSPNSDAFATQDKSRELGKDFTAGALQKPAGRTNVYLDDMAKWLSRICTHRVCTPAC